MNRKILLILGSLSFCVFLAGCGVEDAIRRNDDRYMVPGMLEPSISSNPYYARHSFTFLGKYKVSHEWLNTDRSCGYGGYFGKPNGVELRIFDSLGFIYEEDGRVWYQADKSYAGKKSNGECWRTDFDRYVRSIKVQSPIYGTPSKEEVQASEKAQWERIERARKTGRYESKKTPDIVTPIGFEEKEVGFQALCFESWMRTSHFLGGRLHKRDLATWRAMLTEENPNGIWSERRIGSNVWLVQETSEQDFRPRPLNGVGGPFQTWLLPISDTGYTLGMELGASRESLQYPDAHERMKAMFRHLIESVKIEPLQP
ncbi:hypothetical protein KJ781_04545 [Patescibacteria group bacterium]|nr:hypothetical protein [Patescibacteria group bacterium]